MLTLQQSAGNAAVAAMVGRQAAEGPQIMRAPPKLRTALDSELKVSAQGGGYVANLELGKDAKPTVVQIASYTPIGTTPLKQLPIFLEDIVTDDRAVVNIRYDSAAVQVTPAFEETEAAGVKIQVKLIPSTAEQMTVAAAPGARRVHGGVTIEGREKITEHSSASATDKIIGSIASAEGGFASTEGSDAGVFTWGQGQWTVTTGQLQRVMAFIKDRRRDLFDRYWGAADLDVSGSDFVHDGKKWPKDKKSMMELFRPNLARIEHWAPIFAQAGMDPQIQRLQREFLRGEVEEKLEKRIDGHTPETVLDTRGQAYFYSMDKNLPVGAKANFKAALAKVNLPKGDEISDELKAQVSEELGELFKNSSVLAHSNDKHHIIAFWGEGGRTKAVKQADDAIAAGGDKTWSVDKWKRHKEAMEARKSRYEKTKADIDKAISKQSVEPDVPDGAFSDMETGSGPAAATPAPDLGAAAPAGAAANGKQADGEGGGWGGWFGDVLESAKGVLDLAATGIGLQELDIKDPVGRGGKNRPQDVAQIRARLLGVGYPTADGIDGLGETIERYQEEVVGLRKGDGRVDPGGKTIRALGAMRRAPVAAPAATAATPPDAGAQPAAEAAPARPEAAPAKSQPGVAKPEAAPAKPGPAKPEAAPQPVEPVQTVDDAEARKLIASVKSPTVNEVDSAMAALEKQAAGVKKFMTEEKGEERDQLVENIGKVRAKIAAIGPGLDAQIAAQLRAYFYHRINVVSPSYTQENIDILEYENTRKKGGYRTCNVTSLAMALEALGKSNSDYKPQAAVAAVAKFYAHRVDDARDAATFNPEDLRLPDFLQLAAVAEVLGAKVAPDAAIKAAGGTAWNSILNLGFIAKLAQRFDAKVDWRYFRFNSTIAAEAASKKKKKKSYGPAGGDETWHLRQHGERHRTAGDLHADAANELEDIEEKLKGSPKNAKALEARKKVLEAKVANTKGLSDAKTDKELPLEEYKQSVIDQVGPSLDAGGQVIMGMWGHFARVQSVDEEIIVVDDPAQWGRANRKVTWEEARAMGYFWQWLVVS